MQLVTTSGHCGVIDMGMAVTGGHISAISGKFVMHKIVLNGLISGSGAAKINGGAGPRQADLATRTAASLGTWRHLQIQGILGTGGFGVVYRAWDPHLASEADWAYERGLASNLLNDTRLYRVAAEERGLKKLAGVMGDLELVLLQTSLAETPDPATLEQIQRLIHKRDLVAKMEVTTGS